MYVLRQVQFQMIKTEHIQSQGCKSITFEWQLANLMYVAPALSPVTNIRDSKFI